MTVATMKPAPDSTGATTAGKRRRGRPRNTLQTHAQRRAFLKVFALTGNLKKSAGICGLSTSLHRTWLKDPEYVQALGAAKRAFVRRLENECIRRAVIGERKYLVGPDGQPEIDPDTGRPIFRLVYSDALLVKLMAAWCPFYFDADARKFGKLTDSEQERVRNFAERWPELIARHRRKFVEILATGNPLLDMPQVVDHVQDFTTEDLKPSDTPKNPS